jgi:hypothetical protein
MTCGGGEPDAVTVAGQGEVLKIREERDEKCQPSSTVSFVQAKAGSCASSSG